MGICKLCNKQGEYKDLCRLHYTRWKRNGSFEVVRKSIPRFTKNGYLRIYVNGKRMQEHRYIMEQFIKRPLRKNEHVHHINHNRTDNRIENLMITDPSSHAKIFHTKQVIVDWSQYKVPPKTNRWHPIIYKKCLIENCKNRPLYRSLCMKHFVSYRRNYC